MDNHHGNEKETNERKTSNTEYIPTKCRITRPPPPKPATNPLQFVKVAPCPLYQKAQEQIKKVEEIKKERKEVREETEDWQQNLDNWKSSRRKLQEHIIERVVEVKKLEQEEHEKSRRKSKTFSEMIEDRRGRHKFSIPIFEDDSNDLSDYGIGSSSSKTNSIKDVDTDDSCSVLDEKDHNAFETCSNKENSSGSNLSQSEDETVNNKEKPKKENTSGQTFTTTYTTHLNKSPNAQPKPVPETKLKNDQPKESEQYTYEGAIQDYRSRIQSKIHVDESIFTRNKDISKSKEFSEAQNVLPKGEIFKRKELFEGESKPLEINHFESNTSRRLFEDFANTRSIKDRLKSLERSTDLSLKSIDKSDIQVSVKQRLQNFNKHNDDNQNNNTCKAKPKAQPIKISNYLIDKLNSTPELKQQKPASPEWKNDATSDYRSSSPETEIYMNQLNRFNRDLDNLMNGKDMGSDDYCNNSNYPASTSSVEMTGVSSDREDSGIHTADVSCSVSQADEPVDEIISNTIPNCIEKLKEAKSMEDEQQTQEPTEDKENIQLLEEPQEEKHEEPIFSKETLIKETTDLLEDLRRDSSINFPPPPPPQKQPEEIPEKVKNPEIIEAKPKPVVYENVQLKPFDNSENFVPMNFVNGPFEESFVMPTTMKEPPKVKPPPPPPPEDDAEILSPNIKRLNSTKRLKKEIHIKRSSFLGLEEPSDDQIDPMIQVEKPPDLTSFLQKECKMEKMLYKKLQEERTGMLSKVESQDSGLDIDRGRLSSDTWCSSNGGSTTASHERQDSEQTNSITSEEDEITKKEREIIEMVEKEEKSRDTHSDYVMKPSVQYSTQIEPVPLFEPSLGSDQFKNPYFPQQSSGYLDDHDSEVLKVEKELIELEREELERKRDNILFQESRAKARMASNRRSLENICDGIYSPYSDGVNYRKSMPELQNVPMEYRKSTPDMQSTYNNYRRGIPNVDVQFRKSMPDIQNSSQNQHLALMENDIRPVVDHRKSMPELQHSSAFISPSNNRQPIMPGKPLRPHKEPIAFNPISPEAHLNGKQSRQLSKHSLQALSAVPRPRHTDNWLQPKANPESKCYNQHWLIHEAELRRISEQQKNAVSNRNWQQPKPLPDSIIQSLTQRVQNRSNINERNPQIRRSEATSPVKQDMKQHPSMGHPQTMGHALPIPYSPPALEETQDRMLSVSGKKKCSYCKTELGRGAAMIIESLCLFYHVDCFKCCVCHVKLGNGLMGTDVRVRNQKLHCHNCYSSDDGIKFSCV